MWVIEDIFIGCIAAGVALLVTAISGSIILGLVVGFAICVLVPT